MENFLRSLVKLPAILCIPFGLALSSTGAHAAPPPPHNPSKTVANLTKAAQGEQDAANRYRIYADKAQKDGQLQVAKLFHAAAQSESIHLRNHLAVLDELGVKPKLNPPAPVPVADSRQNLETPIKNEQRENQTMYPNFIRQARLDGVKAAVDSFSAADISEKQHMRLFQQALRDFGREPARDYFVNNRSGETLAVNRGSHPTVPDSGNYQKIG